MQTIPEWPPLKSWWRTTTAGRRLRYSRGSWKKESRSFRGNRKTLVPTRFQPEFLVSRLRATPGATLVDIALERPAALQPNATSNGNRPIRAMIEVMRENLKKPDQCSNHPGVWPEVDVEPHDFPYVPTLCMES